MDRHHNLQRSDDAILLSHDELLRRLSKVKKAMEQSGIETALICSNANIYYLTGRVFNGYILISYTQLQLPTNSRM